MTQSRLALLSLLGAFALAFSSCASTDAARRKAERKELEARTGSPKNYSLYKAKDIDWKLLKKGQRARGGPALDSY